MQEQSDPLFRTETRREFLTDVTAAVIGAPVAAATALAMRRGSIISEMIEVILKGVGPLPATAEGVVAAEKNLEAVKMLADTGKVIYPTDVIPRMEGRVEAAKRAFGRASLQQGFNDPPEETPVQETRADRRIDVHTEDNRLILSDIMGRLEHVRERLFMQLGHIANANIQE